MKNNLNNSRKVSHAFFIAGLLAIFAVNLAIVNATETEIPDQYSSELELGTTHTYSIKNSSGNVTYVVYNPDWSVNSSELILLETDGTITVQIVGFSEVDEPLINISFYHANGDLNASFSDLGQLNLAYTLIMGVGSATYGFLASNNWTETDNAFLAVANQDPEAMFSLNGTLSISETSGIKTYSYEQNPDLGAQQTEVSYDMDTGILRSLNTQFGNFYLEIESSTGYSSELELGATHTYTIKDSSGEVEYIVFNPDWTVNSSQFILLEKGGTIEAQLVGFSGSNEPILNVKFYQADGKLNTSLSNIPQSNIAFTLVMGISSASYGFVAPNNWTEIDNAFLALANQDPEEAFSLNGTLSISESRGIKTYNYSQNPDFGEQRTEISYNMETGLLTYLNTQFGNFSLEITSAELEITSVELEIPGYTLSVLLLSFTGTMMFIAYTVKKRQ